MKTKDKILSTSLKLFNEEGEAHVTTVDIANEMEISPGNLYYHYRGKELIIEELFDVFEREMIEILSAPVKKDIKLQDAWFYLYIVFEHIYDYRFLYHNLMDMIQRHEKIQRRFKRLIKMKHSTARALIKDMLHAGMLVIKDEEEQEALANQIVLTILYWMSFNMLSDRLVKSPEILMHEGVFQVSSLIAPHLSDDKKVFFDECKKLHRDFIANAVLNIGRS